MSELQIRKATRQGVRPLISFYSESGGGKTYSALLLARGFVGPNGKMVLIDSESGRGELYSDVPEFGGYEVLPLDEPFSPSRYIEAMGIVEKSGAAIGICDSASHEWEGISGVLDMADQSRERSGKDGLHNWRKPKMEHAMFLQKLLRSPIPWIICLRAKYKTRQAKDNNGKTIIVKDDVLTPIQADDFIFESTVHAALDMKHNFWPTKVSHPELAKCLPNGTPITLEHGRLLASWCQNPGSSPTAPTKEQPTKSLPSGPTKMLLELRNITASIHKWNGQKDTWESAKCALEDWLVEQTILGESETLADLSLERLTEVLSETRSALNTQNSTQELL